MPKHSDQDIYVISLIFGLFFIWDNISKTVKRILRVCFSLIAGILLVSFLLFWYFRNLGFFERQEVTNECVCKQEVVNTCISHSFGTMLLITSHAKPCPKQFLICFLF